LFLSGQISINPETNEFIDGDIEIQTEQVLKNIKEILEAGTGNSSLEDVVKVTIYLQDIKDFALVNKIYSI
jgi:2-iminobutanoate/2-iminopropanoate deaminase